MYNVWENKFRFFDQNHEFCRIFQKFWPINSLMTVFWAIFRQKTPFPRTLFWYAQKAIFQFLYRTQYFFAKNRK